MRLKIFLLLKLGQCSTIQSEWRKQILEKRFQNDRGLPEFSVPENKISILEWWGKGNSLNAPPLKTEILPDQCGGCYWTNDRSSEKNADAILVDNIRYITHEIGDMSRPTYKNTPPSVENRNTDQYWIFWAREAASKSVERGIRTMQGEYDAAFNLTTSYRRDSDIPRPFGTKDKVLIQTRYRKIENSDNSNDESYEEVETGEENIKSIMSQKSNSGNYVAWMVSNCEETRGAVLRQEYVRRLIDLGLKLDGYGKCFEKELNENPWNRKKIVDGKQQTVYGHFAKYKFYLAFENSIHCNDYISEKFWRNSLGQGLVPIVSGPHPDDVKAVAPKKSYIHVEDFAKPEELIDYLNYLDSNNTAYMEYHHWRLDTPNFDSYVPKTPELEMKCGICRELQRRKQHGNPRKTYKSVAHWWWMNMQDEECTAGAEIDSWVKDISDNVSDEMNLVSALSKKDSENQLAAFNNDHSFTSSNQTQYEHHRSRTRKPQHVYVWNPSQNL